MTDSTGWLIILICALFVSLIAWGSSAYTEDTIIKSCEERGVYLSQKGLLVCEWRTPQKLK